MADKPLVLIIEDEIDFSTICASALETAGFEVEAITDGRAAMQRLDTTTPDVVVLDLQLPHVSGAKILDRIRADERLAETHVIIATANPHMAEGLHEKADLVLVKPISFSQLCDLAARLVPTSSKGGPRGGSERAV